MRTVNTLPWETLEEQVWVPLRDGTRLRAHLWRPTSSDLEPVPAILEMIPYRQRDLTARRDSMHHPYFAGHGYAGVRVDLRGSGDSEGVLTDEYLEEELTDARDVLGWLAEQPWCTGRVGMMGISWGGFNALQVAARRPPELAAVVSVSSTDDRYADDVHYMGGCLLSDNLSWASTMFAYNSCPPDPAVAGERWREMWHERLARSGLWLENWLRHQRRDQYWEHGSICEDYSAVCCPVLAVSGWADGYSNSVFRLLENLKVPRLGLIGPWSHKYPHLGVPGPAIGFLQELLRWWEHWLKDVDNDVLDEPMLRIWMQESVPPFTAYERRPGRWVGVPDWPSSRIQYSEHALQRNTITSPGQESEESPCEELTIQSPLSLGQYAGKWCSYNAPPDLPYDQREEDGGSLNFDTGVFDERWELLGSPLARLDIAVNEPVAMVAARLSDVAPDGRATRISYGLLNLTHHNGHERPEPLVPGRRYTVDVLLNGMAQAIPEGHRLRLAISTSYWPLAWPPPRPVMLSVFSGSSRLLLPVRRVPDSGELELSPFDEPEGTEPVATTQIEPGQQRWTVSRDLVRYESALEVVKDLGVVRLDDIALRLTRRAYERYGWVGDDVTSARGETEWTIGFRRDDWDVHTVTRTVLTCTETEFQLRAELDAYEGEQRVASYNWDRSVVRDHL